MGTIIVPAPRDLKVNVKHMCFTLTDVKFAGKSLAHHECSINVNYYCALETVFQELWL